MADLTQIPAPNGGPITDKIREIYEHLFPPEEQIPLPGLLTSTQLGEASLLVWISPSLSASEDGTGNMVALTLSFVFPGLFYLGFLTAGRCTRSTGHGSHILTYFRERYGDVPQLLEIEPVVCEARNYQQRAHYLALYEHNGFTVTSMLTHEADQIYRVLARNRIMSPQRLEEALNSVTDDPVYASRMTTD